VLGANGVQLRQVTLLLRIVPGVVGVAVVCCETYGENRED